MIKNKSIYVLCYKFKVILKEFNPSLIVTIKKTNKLRVICSVSWLLLLMRRHPESLVLFTPWIK